MKYLTAIVLGLFSANLWAVGPPAPIPEPETLFLIWIGLAALVATHIKKRR